MLNRSEADSVRRNAVAPFASFRSTRIMFCSEMKGRRHERDRSGHKGMRRSVSAAYKDRQYKNPLLLSCRYYTGIIM
jgi:hypothetical protein